jgi:hypothetical protein
MAPPTPTTPSVLTDPVVLAAPPMPTLPPAASPPMLVLAADVPPIDVLAVASPLAAATA